MTFKSNSATSIPPNLVDSKFVVNKNAKEFFVPFFQSKSVDRDHSDLYEPVFFRAHIEACSRIRLTAFTDFLKLCSLDNDNPAERFPSQTAPRIPIQLAPVSATDCK